MKNRSTEDAVQLWHNILSKLNGSPQEIQTVNKTGSAAGGKWFQVNVVDDTVYIDEAMINTPSSRLTNIRAISKTEFMALYPNYFKWRAGTMSREQAKGNSMNSSYIFALINSFDI